MTSFIECKLLNAVVSPEKRSTWSERSSDSETLDAIVDWNIESEPESASEAEDGESLEGVEYEDRSVDGSDSAASLEDFLDEADSSDVGQPTTFSAALDNLLEEQVSINELLFKVTELCNL
jgi:hypothetical protein